MGKIMANDVMSARIPIVQSDKWAASCAQPSRHRIKPFLRRIGVVLESESSIPCPEERLTSKRRRNNLAVNRTAGETILHKAARLGRVDLLEEKIREGIDVNAVDNAGWSPLHEACAAGFEDGVKMLLQHGANPNCTSDSGVRPIHDAFQSGNVAVVRVLLMYGAYVQTSSASGLLPEHFTSDVPLQRLLEGFWVDQQVKDVPVESEGFKKGKWQFSGSSTITDNSEDARALLQAAPADSGEPVVVAFQLSQREFPQSYYLPCLQDGKIVGYRNYFHLPDLLKLTGMSREAFSRSHREKALRIEPWSVFQRYVEQSQIAPRVTHEMFDLRPSVELVSVANSAMSKLLDVRNLNV